MAGLRITAAETCGLPESAGVAHGPGRRPLVRDGPQAARDRRTPRPEKDIRVYCPSRLRRRSTASRDSRLSRSSHAAYFALMRASLVLPGFSTSEWRDSNPRPRGPQPRALPTAPHSVRTPAGTRTRIDGCDILPRLWRRGLPAQEPQWVQYRQAIPTCPVVRTIYESCYSMILIASSRIFRAAFTSRSCNTPHDGHAHSRTLKSLTRGFL